MINVGTYSEYDSLDVREEVMLDNFSELQSKRRDLE
jgi:hypothetical protein